MDNKRVTNYTEYLRSVIEEQSKRIAKLEFLLTPTPTLNDFYLNGLQREFF